MTFAETLHRAMGNKGMDAKTLAEKSGVTAPYLSKLLNGKIKEPTWAKACSIIDALDMSVDDFKKLQESK